jgi:hypothetical protein
LFVFLIEEIIVDFFCVCVCVCGDIDTVAIARAQPQLATYNATLSSVGTNRTNDSNGIDNGRGTVAANVTTGALGSVDLSIDFGFFQLLEIGNYVWRDNSGDGLQQANEPSMAGVVLQLTSADGALIGTTITDATGRYSFDAVNFGIQPRTSYMVVVQQSALPSDTTATWSTPTADKSLDSNARRSASGQSYTATVIQSYVFLHDIV